MDPDRQADHDAVMKAILLQQEDPGDHDLSLIQERLEWTPEERLEANAMFVRWYLSVRPQGPLIR